MQPNRLILALTVLATACVVIPDPFETISFETSSEGDWGDGDPGDGDPGDGDPGDGDPGDGDPGDGDPGDGDPGDGDGDPGDGDGDPGPGGDCHEILISTTMGDMFISLDPINAPITVANFEAYIDAGFYDGTIFHRVIDGFMIQGGGFTPGMVPKQTMPPIPLELSSLSHVNGAISMARAMDPNSATSQFFICDGPQGFLDGQYAAFGVMNAGFDVLAAISAVQTGMVDQFGDVPVEDVVINFVDYACD